MYVSSDGTKKDVKTLDSAYLVNAISKAYREIWNSLTREQYDMFFNNIQVLRNELDIRLKEFDIKKFGGKVE